MRPFTYGFLALVIACAADPASSQPTDEDYASVAASIGSTTAHDGGEIAAMRQAVALVRDDDQAGFTQRGDGSFDGAMSGLAFHYRLACAGAESVAPCDRTSSAATVDATWAGTLELPERSLDLQHDARWQLSRMTGAIAHVDGTGHLVYQTRDLGSAYQYSYDATYHVVVNDVRAIGGEIHFVITGQHAGADAPYAVTADVTFAPDDTADLVLDGTHQYQILLATGAVTPIAP
ncbi:MAG: hypothetical protein ABIY55_17310 [Kofleriaceae bacterium]